MADATSGSARQPAFPRVRLLKARRARGSEVVASPAPVQANRPRSSHAIELTVNGTPRGTTGRGNETLAETLRDRLELRGTKVGCNDGSCGTCTVLLDGEPVYACMVLSDDCLGQRIETIEGLGSEANPHPLQVAFAETYAAQCGFCTPGAIMAAKALLDRVPQPDVDQVRLGLSGVICRCGYLKIIEATIRAAHRT